MPKNREQPSPWCELVCEFLKRKDFETCTTVTNCFHLEDRQLPPRTETLNLPDGPQDVTIVGENVAMRRPRWILSDGSMIHKDHPWR